MAKAPLVSVILPVYNGAAFLQEAVSSLLGQTVGDFEILAIDDGSTDDSVAILESFHDPRIRILRNPANMRLIFSLNRGLEEAKGAFVARMDADDVSLPTRFAMQLEYFASHPDVAVLGTGVIRIDEKGKKGDTVRLPLGLAATSLVWRPPSLPHPSVMMRAEIARKFRYDPESLHCEDYDLWIRVVQAGYKIANLEEPLLLYRMHENAVSSQFRGLQLRESYKVFSRRFVGFGLSFEDYLDLVGAADHLSFSRRFQLFRELDPSGHSGFGFFVRDLVQRLKRKVWQGAR